MYYALCIMHYVICIMHFALCIIHFIYYIENTIDNTATDRELLAVLY